MQAAWPCHTCSVICPRRQPDATKSRTAPRRGLRRLFNRTPHPAPRTRTRPGRPRHEHLASLGTTRLRAQRLDGVTGALNVPGGRHVHRPIRILKVRQLSRKCENVRAVLAQRGVREQLVCAARKGKGTARAQVYAITTCGADAHGGIGRVEAAGRGGPHRWCGPGCRPP